MSLNPLIIFHIDVVLFKVDAPLFVEDGTDIVLVFRKKVRNLADEVLGDDVFPVLRLEFELSEIVHESFRVLFREAGVLLSVVHR